MNPNLISLLSEGKIATRLENIDQADKLKQILLTAFPEDNYLKHHPNYLKSLNRENKVYFLSTIFKKWYHDDTTNLPIVPIDHFFLTINDVCLQGSETLKQLFKNLNIDTEGYDCNVSYKYYFIRNNRVNCVHMSSETTKKILTEDQFKLYFSQSKQKEMKFDTTLIKRLQKREIALKQQNGTFDELKMILTEAFPKDNFINNNYFVPGSLYDKKYFYARKSNHPEWNSSNENSLPYYTIKDFMNKKQQIGWKISKPEYNKAALQIADCAEWNNYKWDFAVNSIAEINLKKAEVLELWCTPVYEEVSKDKEFTLNCTGGSFHLTVKKEGLLYVPDNKILDVTFLKGLIAPTNYHHQNYKFTRIISHLDMGCKKRVPIEDIQKCIDYWEENFK